MTFDLDFTDEEMDAVFKQMQALKVTCFCTNQSRIDVAARLVPFAERYKIRPAWHPHAMVQDPNEVATPESMEKLLAMSKYFAINLDIGHFTAGNNDAAAFLKKHHDRITHIHIKDRKRNGGPNVALGSGDTPIKECLALIRDNKYPIYGIIEREFRGPGSPADETKGQLEYLKQILSASQKPKHAPQGTAATARRHQTFGRGLALRVLGCNTLGAIRRGDMRSRRSCALPTPAVGFLVLPEDRGLQLEIASAGIPLLLGGSSERCHLLAGKEIMR
jgi:hypothetical protein